MNGKVALITGAGRGIGLGIVQGLSSAGAAVAIQDIDLDVAKSEARKINEAGGRAIALGGDIGDLAAPGQWVEQTVQQLGGLHILVNNAAIQQRVDWMELTPRQIEEQYRANVTTPLLLCQLAAAIFKEQHFGRIINLGSVQQRTGNPLMLAYSMTKGALGVMTTALARDLAAAGITVNMISPGYFNTYRNREDFPTPEDLAEKGRWIPVGRIGEPRDAAGLAVLLCSDAASYITGQIIYLDGGLTSR